MNLHALLTKREAQKGPLRVGLIGAGKFGSMFLAQARDTRGIHLAAIADLLPARDSSAAGCFPIGLAHGIPMVRPVTAGQRVTWDDVAWDGKDATMQSRRGWKPSSRPDRPLSDPLHQRIL